MAGAHARGAVSAFHFLRTRGLVRLSAALALAVCVSPHASETHVDLFAAHPVCVIRIELTAGNVESLRAENRKYVPANVRALGEIFRDVGIHLKGSTGSFRSIDDKPGLTLDFERFVPDQRFRGLRKIHLNNCVEDSTYLKEQIGSELFRAARVPVPRIGHAWVELNRRPLGLYVLKEGFTEEFLGRHFERADGNLYDTDEGHDVNLPMKRHSGRDSANNQIDLQRLAAAALEPDLGRRWERLQESLDVDRFVTFIALEVMICHWDGYCLGRNNFRIYHDPTTQKFVFLPSGMDQLFAKADMPWRPDMAGLVARGVMEVPEGRQQYAERFKELYRTLLVSERLTNRVNQLLIELRPFVKSDLFREMHREAAELCLQIAERELSLGRQLSEPEPQFPQFNHEMASLAAWKSSDEAGGARMREMKTPAGKPALQIIAGSRTAASWRTTVLLSQGRYRFRGQAQVFGVTPLPFGKNHGANLRVAGRSQRSSRLTGTSAWKTLEVDFDVRVPEEKVELICELRASAGEVRFERDSLVVIRQH